MNVNLRCLIFDVFDVIIQATKRKGDLLMLNGRIAYFRKQKGLTQEELAIRLNVVRQTVSKWEKGLSVPDADMLIKLAEVFEVEVAELLGGEINQSNSNEIVDQLSRINEQLAIKNRRAKKIGKIVAGVLIFIVAVGLIIAILGATLFTVRVKSSDRKIAGTTEYVCTLDGKEYGYEISYNENYEILAEGGDVYIGSVIDPQSDAHTFDVRLKDYFKTRGGKVEVSSSSGLELSTADIN